MEEIWKDIQGYEGLYQISNMGNVRSLLFINGKSKIIRKKTLKQNITKHKRCLIHLYKNTIRKAKSVHRLVAEAFLSNQDSLPEVNHIDGNTLNNKVTNLEWCSKSYNSKHAYINNLSKLKKFNENEMKSIIRSDGKIYKNSYEASRDLCVSVCSIRDVLKGRTKTCKNYKFEYIS